MTSDKSDNRIKEYERNNKHFLMKKTPVIIRVDGRAFKSFTKSIEEPIDKTFHKCLIGAAKHTAKNIQGASMIYAQSDEVSFLLKDWTSSNAESWFGYNQNKIETITASLMTASFNYLIYNFFKDTPIKFNTFATFDARSFNLPKEEVLNYFISRQRNSITNSIQTIGHHHFSHDFLYEKNNDQIKELLLTKKGIYWETLPIWMKEGSVLIKLNEKIADDRINNTNVINMKANQIKKNGNVKWKSLTKENNFQKNSRFFENYFL